MTYEAVGKQVLFVHRDTKVPTHIADAGDPEKADFLAKMANGPQGEDGGPLIPFDYMSAADKTCSVIFNSQNVPMDDFKRTLHNIIGYAEDMNVYKKLLFRGKLPADLHLEAPLRANSLAVVFDPQHVGEDELNILHGIVGVITEAGEMAEVLLGRLNNDKFDKVNVAEESGDVLWYLARQLRGLNTNFDAIGEMNIDKLHGRHGDGFDVFRDANRNLDAERQRLETTAPLFEQTAGLPALDAIPARVRNDPPLPAGAQSAPNVGNGGENIGEAPVERHDKRNAGDCEGMDC